MLGQGVGALNKGGGWNPLANYEVIIEHFPCTPDKMQTSQVHRYAQTSILLPSAS